MRPYLSTSGGSPPHTDLSTRRARFITTRRRLWLLRSVGQRFLFRHGYAPATVPVHDYVDARREYGQHSAPAASMAAATTAGPRAGFRQPFVSGSPALTTRDTLVMGQSRGGATRGLGHENPVEAADTEGLRLGGLGSGLVQLDGSGRLGGLEFPPIIAYVQYRARKCCDSC